MKRYLVVIKEWVEKFLTFKIKHIPHTSNIHVDALVTLSSLVFYRLKILCLF